MNDLVTEYSLKQSNSNSSNRGLEAESPVNVGKIVARYQAGKSRAVEKEGIVKLPTASLFADLYTILNSKDKVQRLVGFDDEICNQLRPGEFIELDGAFSQSPLELIFSSLADTVNQYKDFFLAQKETQQLVLLSQMLRPKKITLIIRPYSSVLVSFVSSLDLAAENLFKERYEIEGEFTIFGRVRRITPKETKVDLFNFLPGKLKVMEKQLTDVLQSFKNMEQQGLSFGSLSEMAATSFFLDGPVIEINPIAIYQNY